MLKKSLSGISGVSIGTASSGIDNCHRIIPAGSLPLAAAL
jgi:hypothetical protein